MTKPTTGDTVTIDYVLKRTDGEVVGTTEQVGPQDIALGSGEIFPQIEQALAGMSIGEAQSVAIACADAFGPRRDELVMDLPRANLPSDPAPRPGMVLQGETAEGHPVMMEILEVGGDTVKVDGNHPLAGEDLTFDLTLRDIMAAA